MGSKKQLLKMLGLFSVIFAIASALLFLVALSHYWQTTLKERTEFENNEKSTVLQGKTAIEQQLTGVVSDINFLAAYGEHYRTVNGQELSLFSNHEVNKQVLTRLLKNFSQQKKVYDQIRFLNTDGVEQIRINYNNGQTSAVTLEKLQRKSSRYYVQELKKLKPGELYVSPFDLNIEQGKIEIPYKPVLRFGKPVYNAQGKHMGALLLNFMGTELLQAFRAATQHAQNHILLLNKEGYWLSSPDKKREWGFMFGKNNHFQDIFYKQSDTGSTHTEQTWKRIQQQKQGQFYTKKWLISFATVNPLPATTQILKHTLKQSSWTIVSILPRSHPALGGTFDQYRSLYGSILLLLGIGSWLLASTIIKHRQSELQVAFEQRFRQVLENVDLLAVGLDKQGTIIFCNKTLAKLTGWKRQKLFGKNWFDTLVADGDKHNAQQKMAAFIAGKTKEIHEDALIKTCDDQILKVAWNHTLMTDPDNEILGLTCIGENVTEIRSQQKQVLTLSRAVEQSPVVVMIVATDGGIQYVNPRFTQVTGYSLDEVRGKNPSLLRANDNDNKEENKKYQILWKDIGAGKTWQGIFKNKRKNGTIYWASATISALRDQGGAIVNYIGVQEDITEHMQLEATLDQRNQEIAKSKTLAAVGRMASMIAHDLRNPLSSIKMSLQILNKPARPGTKEQINELKQIALEQVTYMELMLADLLNYARPAALKPEWISMDHLLNETLNMMQSTLSSYQVQLNTHIDKKLPKLFADEGKLTQVFSNLLDNAIQVAVESGKIPAIRIEVQNIQFDSNPAIRISIIDNGTGLKGKDIEQLFEPFYTTRAKGSGLGLAIAKGFVEQHHGKIILTDNPAGEGAICTVILAINTTQTSHSINYLEKYEKNNDCR